MNQRNSKCLFYFRHVMDMQEPQPTANPQRDFVLQTKPSSLSQPSLPDNYPENLRSSPIPSNYARDSEAPPEREIDDPMVIDGPERLEPEPEPHHFYTEFHPKANYQDIRTGKTFMDLFDEDPYAEHRAANLYYLFASQEEWQLASFLLKSGLSMSAIDEFLKLDLVCVSAASGIIFTSNTSHDITID